MKGYKQMWEAGQQEIEVLKAEVNRLAALIAAGPDENAREVERTRVIVDLAGIARHMKVERYTPQQWRQRGWIPPVDFPLIREPLWYASTIKDKFVIPTRRRWYDNPAEELSPVA